MGWQATELAIDLAAKAPFAPGALIEHAFVRGAAPGSTRRWSVPLGLGLTAAGVAGAGALASGSLPGFGAPATQTPPRAPARSVKPLFPPSGT